MHGVFEAHGRPRHNIERKAFAPMSFPAQIRIGCHARMGPATFVPVGLLSWHPRFGPLTASQVRACR